MMKAGFNKEWEVKGKNERDWAKYKVIFFDENTAI